MHGKGSGCMRFIVRRLALFVAVLLVMSMVIFVVVHVLPGDMATVIAGVNATPTQVSRLRAQLGLDKPLFMQYWDWLYAMCTGNLGVSMVSGRTVGELLLARAQITIPFVLIATVVSVCVGVSLGIVMSVSSNRWLTSIVHVFALIGGAMPALWGGMLLMLLFGKGVGIIAFLPSQGFALAGWSNPLQALASLCLPALSVAIIVAASFMRYTAHILQEQSKSGVVEMAMAQGMTRVEAIIRVGLRLSLPQLVSVVGLTCAQMITGVLVIENLFALSGLGSGLISDIGNRDYLSVQSELLLLTLVFLLIGLVVDIFHYVLDPRIRNAT